MPMTFGEQARKLTSFIPNLDAQEARKRINLSYKRESEGYCWSHLIKRWTLQTEAAYSTGTVAVSNGGTSVVLTGGTWAASWSTVPSSRKIIIAGRPEPYDVTITGAAAGTLVDAWLGADVTEATYVMYRDTYPLPADCGYSKLLVLFDPLLRDFLRNLLQRTFIMKRALDIGACNVPRIMAVMNQTTEAPPRPQLQFWPAPLDVRAYHGWYFRRPSFMSADSEYPDWPAEFEDLIWRGAVVEHYSSVRTYSMKYLAEQKPRYADLFKRMKKEMDGDAALDVYIEDLRLGRGTGSNANWTPDPSTLSGTGTMSW